MPEMLFSWNVPVDHPAFAGHFPDHPIVPGVVLLDRAILCAEQLLGQSVAHWQIGNAKFLSPVGPGETVHFTLERKASGAIAFIARADDQRTVASGSLTLPAS